MSPESNLQNKPTKGLAVILEKGDAFKAYKEKWGESTFGKEHLPKMNTEASALLDTLLQNPNSCETYEEIIAENTMATACNGDIPTVRSFMKLANAIHETCDAPELHEAQPMHTGK